MQTTLKTAVGAPATNESADRNILLEQSSTSGTRQATFKDKPRAAYERIDSSKALKYLATMQNNRQLVRSHFLAIARDMKARRFVGDGSPLRFDSQGRLFDGQHRLRALVETGLTLLFLVVR